MEDQEIDLLQKRYDKKFELETWKRKRDWYSRHSFYDYCDKHRKYFKHLLNGNVGNNWSDVYSKISKKIPPLARQHLVDRYINFPDRNGKYRYMFDPSVPQYWGDQYYIDMEGVLKITKASGERHRLLYPKKIKKKPKPKLDPLFKFDYDLETTIYDGKFKNLRGKFYITTSTSVDDEGKIKEHKTYFTKDQFIDWAERHKKTYHIQVVDWSGLYRKLLETFTKISYDE